MARRGVTLETKLTDRYAVVGQPISHSRSPEIHAAFAASTGQDISYGRIEGSPLTFEADVTRFFAEGGCGLNVTLPFKERAFAMAHNPSERARCAGAANTLGMGPDGLWADNTDGIGLVRDLTLNLGAALQGATVLLLGAGGAARGVIHPLLEAGIDTMWVANRTPSRAQRLVAELGGASPRLRAVAWTQLTELKGVELILNATASAVNGGVFPLPANIFLPQSWAYDLGYGRALTPFLLSAQQLGVTRLSDGLGMLVEQAAVAFESWRGVHPETRGVIEALRG